MKKKIRLLEANPQEVRFRGPPRELAKIPRQFALHVLGAKVLAVLMLVLRLCYQLVQDAIGRHERRLAKILPHGGQRETRGGPGDDAREP